MGFLDYKGLERFLKNSREEFAQKSHTHDERYYTEYEIDNKLSKKSDVDHIHDDRYYTEAEVDGKLEKKSSTDHTHDLSELISALSIGTSTTLNDAVQIITQDTDTANQKYYRRPLTVLWNYIKSKADSVYSAIGHTHKIQNLEDYTTRVYDATIVRPADTVLASPQDKDGIATFRKLDKNDVGLENVDNTADKNKNVATAGIATTGVRDYNNANNIIKIGWSGTELDADSLAYVAGYTSDKKIHPASKDGVRMWLGLGDSAYKNTKSRSSKGSTDWTNNATDDAIVPTMSFMAYWDGAYNSNGASNLSYCDRGRFGTIVTKNTGDYAVAGHTHSFINSVGVKNAQTGRNQIYGDVYSYNSNASANTGMPTTYTSTIGFGQGSAGTVEICGEWTGGKGLWSRALRDYQDNWYDWQRIYTENYHPNADHATSADSATTSNGVKDYNDANRTIKIGYAGSGLNTSNLSHIAGFTDNGTKIKDVSKDVLTSWIGLGNYLHLGGGTMTGNITFSDIGNTNTSNRISWNGSTDGADIYYQTTAGDQGNLVLNLRDDSNCYLRIARNGTFKSYFSPDDGNFHGNVNGNVIGNVSGSSGSCTGNSATATTAAKLGRNGNTGAPMTFNWNGQGGQPTWLWGSNDGSNIYVWNPSNFSVNYANSSGYANSAGSAPANGGTATNAEYISNESRYMRFHWSGQSGQPTWLWGGNDASNMYVWNPSNFSVNYANSAGSAGSATNAGNGVTASGYNYVRFGDGTQMCWGQQDIASAGTTITFAVAFSSIPAVVNSGTEDIDDVFFVRNITTTNFVADKKGWYSGNNTWIAIGRWK